MVRVFLVTTFLVLVSCSHFSHNKSETRVPAQQGKELSLRDYQPYQYEVLFTNPLCQKYSYSPDTRSFINKKLFNKPENVFCKNKFDLAPSGQQEKSPQFRLVQWINDPSTREIFFTYLSFRNRAVKEALCMAAKDRGVKISFINSSTEDSTVADDLVKNCSTPTNQIIFKKRGMEGGIGYAHNKIFIINPVTKINTQEDRPIRIVFSSGNMTSGPVIHHENWHFITTNTRSYFARVHQCVMQAELNDKVAKERSAYMKYIRACRENIAKTVPEESDIKAFFVPGEGEKGTGYDKQTGKQIQYDNGSDRKTAWDYMNEGDGPEFPGISNASKIWLGCHRFFYSNMINALAARMKGSKKPELKMIADDDTFYKANDPNYDVGDTLPEEWVKMDMLVKKGAQVKLMETNPSEHQLHHSKFLIFSDDKGPKAVFAGAANLTGAGFRTNWENTYYITNTDAVNAFAEQYEHLWEDLATDQKDLPKNSMAGDSTTP